MARDDDRQRILADEAANVARIEVAVEPAGQPTVAGGLAYGISAMSCQTCRASSLPRGSSGRSKSRRSRAKYSVSWAVASSKP